MHALADMYPSVAMLPRVHEATIAAWATVSPHLPAAAHDALGDAIAALERPENRRYAWSAVGVLAFLLVSLRVFRGRGDLTVALQYPAEGD